MSDGALDRLVRRAQAGDAAALDRLLHAVRGPLLRFARRLGPAAHAEDATQDALLDIARGLHSYRWEASFLSWAYAICARRVARQARASAAQLSAMADWIEISVAGPPEELDQHEQILTAQHAHLACAFVVAIRLSPASRRAYLLGEVLGVDHHIGAELCGCSPHAFRQRVSRARREVATEVQTKMNQEIPATGDIHIAADELDRLTRLGELGRVRSQTADPAAAQRAATLAAPTLMATPQSAVPSRRSGGVTLVRTAAS